MPFEELGGHVRQENMERETGIEPATNSLEGCDSTTELLPLACVFKRSGTLLPWNNPL